MKAGRRFGKSLFAVNECIDRALIKPNQRVWYLAPLYKQVKEIAWTLFDRYVPKELILKKNEAELKITLVNGSEIALKGCDNADSLVGVGLNYCVLDEAALMKQDVWYQIVRPMLVDTRGEALFITTPRGMNWFYELWNQALEDPDFERFEFLTTDNLAIKDIEREVSIAKKQAHSELEKIMFRQEYEASFEVVTGRPRFDISLLKDMYAKARVGIDEESGLTVWEPVDPLANYVIGADTSEGLITGDKSSAVVINAKTYTVAAEFNGIVSPDEFARRLDKWGKRFNEALIVVEDNNHGLVTLNELKKTYKRLYYRKIKDEISEEWTEKLGWRTSARTKPLLIANLDQALRDGLRIHSKEIINELTTYVIDENGGTNASEGCHDDRVMALACAVQGYLESPRQKEAPKEEVPVYTAAWYMEQKKKNNFHNAHASRAFR